MSAPDAAREIVLGGELAEHGFADWLAPERALISVGTIDAHRRGAAGPPGPRDLVTAFFRMAQLARDLRLSADGRPEGRPSCAQGPGGAGRYLIWS